MSAARLGAAVFAPRRGQALTGVGCCGFGITNYGKKEKKMEGKDNTLGDLHHKRNGSHLHKFLSLTCSCSSLEDQQMSVFTLPTPASRSALCSVERRLQSAPCRVSSPPSFLLVPPPPPPSRGEVMYCCRSAGSRLL